MFFIKILINLLSKNYYLYFLKFLRFVLNQIPNFLLILVNIIFLEIPIIFLNFLKIFLFMAHFYIINDYKIALRWEMIYQKSKLKFF
jgi:hypothetical protein